MTNFEKIMSDETLKGKSFTLQEIGKILCDGVVLAGCSCDECPFTDHCSIGHNGAEEFFKKEFNYA